ncbi:nitroreductase family deazaflavin-dependent oxidoreductase [Nocardia beijingensis]|uniref:nitroreductase/quinone reductase family protein n=1 Tax=Nocardia beijingensis TaxID=95162 RepID=UPI001893713A|nr:nitroreductase/quinone reductase family protein [Nocardia beijingensis]MBF6468117.1 nitroreductase family deazaflavin-dependent oxidoreductase [Nocardia beijingensis]
MPGVFAHVLKVHQWVYEHSGGFVGHRTLLGKPTLLLRTVGRKTGHLRTSALVYGRDGKDYLIAASNGGSPRPPGWLANLKSRPECEIQIVRRRIRVVARALYPGDPHYTRMFQIMDEVLDGQYTAYQKQTTRPTAVVVLSPLD